MVFPRKKAERFFIWRKEEPVQPAKFNRDELVQNHFEVMVFFILIHLSIRLFLKLFYDLL